MRGLALVVELLAQAILELARHLARVDLLSHHVTTDPDHGRDQRPDVLQILDDGFLDAGESAAARFKRSEAYYYFTRGTDMTVGENGAIGRYSYQGSAYNGALLNSNQNYASISFNGNDGIYEAVGQFYLDGLDGGYLVAIARSDDNSALSISDGEAAITAITAVPEASSIALLTLGAAGVLARRRRAA